MANSLRTPKPIPVAAAVDALTDVFELLERVPPSSHGRALRAKAESYQQVVDRWISIPPTAAQHDALVELVGELGQQVRAATTETDEEPPPSSTRPLARIALKPGSTK